MTVKLTDLRDDIDAIVLDLRRERNDGEVPIDDAIARVRSNLSDKISEAADQLIDLTLRKLIHDVSGRVERQARDKKPEHGETQADSIRRFRQQHSVPILNALKTWLDEIAPKVLPDSKLGDAVSYTLNQWEYLTRYTEDGRMPIDNNLLERDIRVFATGRKSWLFSDTADGAKASAVIYSLMLTCRASRVEPLAWLRHVLTELPQRTEDADITDLLPFNFPKASPA
ncbi:transposase [Sinorhizobium meliloti]|uniref:IS66 family transposase n=1 Tax=Rhizobium meliloti TaxID=382 RepID=UPI003D6521F7